MFLLSVVFFDIHNHVNLKIYQTKIKWKISVLFIVIHSVERYNPDTNTWTKISDMNSRRSGAGVGVVDNTLFAVGGHDGPLVRKSCEKYCVETDTWSPIAGKLTSHGYWPIRFSIIIHVFRTL